MIKRTYIPNKHLAFWCVHFTALPTVAKFLPVVSTIVTENSFLKPFVVDIKQNYRGPLGPIIESSNIITEWNTN